MELGEYISVFKKAKLLIIGGTLLIIAIAALVIAFSKPRYDTSVTFTVDKTMVADQKNTPYYQFDGYYTQQSSGFFADTVMNWMQSPSIVADIYKTAGLDLPSVRNVSQLSKVFVVKKYPPATLGIKITSKDPESSKLLLNASATELKRLTDESNTTNATEVFILRSSAPVSTQIKPFWSLDIIVAAILGLVVTTFAAILKHYLSKE